MASINEEHVAKIFEKHGEVLVLDDIIRHRVEADTDEKDTILAYPKGNSVEDYEYISAGHLNRMIDNAVKKYISPLNLGPVQKGQDRKIVAVYSPSDLDMLVTLFALSRLGHTVLMLSTRLPPPAIEHLMRATSCSTLVYSRAPQTAATISRVDRAVASVLEVIPSRDEYDVPTTTPPYVPAYDRATEHHQPAVIIHSSGSTGVPKPITLKHAAVSTLPSRYLNGTSNLTTFPLFHLGGLCTIMMPMHQGRYTIYTNPKVPQTAETLTATINATQPEMVSTVPYILGLMSQSEEGLEALRKPRCVATGGSRTSDELGDRLVKEGVKFGMLFGATEICMAADSLFREPGDDEWSYMRFHEVVSKYVHFDVVDEKEGLYEAVYLGGLKSLSTSNTDSPVPGSWRSKDVFKPHPTIKNAWKYITRLDDRVTLANGEKVLPLPIEGRIRIDPLVKEAVVFGIDQNVPGLLVIRAPEADHLSKPEFVDAIWPSIEDANSRAEGFSQIARDMVLDMPSDTDYPRSDKGTFIRGQVYRKFDAEIQAIYEAAEKGAANSGGDEDKQSFADIASLQQWILTHVREDMGVEIGLDEDFFSAGVDSLRAIQLRRLVQENVALNGATLPPNAVYNCGNVRKLAEYVHRLANKSQQHDRGEADELEQRKEAIRQMVAKYSAFPKGAQTVSEERHTAADANAAILTGATGAIGAHVLAQLLGTGKIDKVYCFCRGKNPILRVLESLRTRKLIKTAADEAYFRAKIVALTAEPQDDGFGLDGATLAQMRREVRVVIHAAWPVNFNISLGSFEEHIRGLKNMIDFSLSAVDAATGKPAQVHFASSISAVLNTKPGSVVPDAPAADYGASLPTGYAMSKLTGEAMCRAARETAGADAYVLRIGQITGDTREGVWNESESYPLMVRAGYRMGVMPDVREVCYWLPLDTLAESIVQIVQAAEEKGSDNLEAAGVEDVLE
ncbi:putative NRPS-like protein biosynthetic cluster [Ascosphaera atra]|nr:putative NRPS-like protein biosynthetic cluster [Ascosphaera atra]